MNCPDEMKVEMLLNGMLSADEAASMNSHIRECPKCGAVYGELKSLDKLIRSVAPVLPDADYLKSFSEQIAKSAAVSREKTVSAIVPFSRIFWGVMQTAAAIVIFVSVWAFVAPRHSHAFKIEIYEAVGVKVITFVPVASEDNSRNTLFGSGGDWAL